MDMMIFSLLFSTFLFAVFLTQLIRSYALNNLMDIPNQRSSHQVPTPRGGSLTIVIAYFSFLAGIFFLGPVAFEPILIITTSLAIVGIGFWDDHQHIAARWRFLTHAVTAAVGLMNLFWLLPLAILAYWNPQYAGLGLLLAYVPLVYVIYRIGAGKQVHN